MSGSPKIRTCDAEASTTTPVMCGICRRQHFRYTCPVCGVSYCSLTCFRSEAHVQCSEAFYRKEIDTNIKSESTRTTEEREKMVELLRRLDELEIEEYKTSVDGSSDEDDGNDLAARLKGLDVYTVPAAELLKCLTKEEQDAFHTALLDPARGLAHKLLASSGFDQTMQKPWWESSDIPSDDHTTSRTHKPPLMDVPPGIIKLRPGAQSLLYNVCAVFIAYAYATRRLSMSPLALPSNDREDRDEARRLVAFAVPFIVDRRSNVVCVSLEEAVWSVWARLNLDAATVALLLGDASRLLRPWKIVVAQVSVDGVAQKQPLFPDHPSALTLMALSDLRSLFEDDSGEHIGKTGDYVVKKITFYAGHVLAVCPSLLDALANEALWQSKMMKPPDAASTSR